MKYKGLTLTELLLVVAIVILVFCVSGLRKAHGAERLESLAQWKDIAQSEYRVDQVDMVSIDKGANVVIATIRSNYVVSGDQQYLKGDVVTAQVEFECSNDWWRILNFNVVRGGKVLYKSSISTDWMGITHGSIAALEEKTLCVGVGYVEK